MNIKQVQENITDTITVMGLGDPVQAKYASDLVSVKKKVGERNAALAYCVQEFYKEHGPMLSLTEATRLYYESARRFRTKEARNFFEYHARSIDEWLAWSGSSCKGVWDKPALVKRKDKWKVFPGACKAGELVCIANSLLWYGITNMPIGCTNTQNLGYHMASRHLKEIIEGIDVLVKKKLARRKKNKKSRV